MLEIQIQGVDGFDGVFPLDLDAPFNGRELHLIKKVSGVRLGEIEEAFSAEDHDLWVACAAIALVRAGNVDKAQAQAVADILMEAGAGQIKINDVTVEEDALPPPAALPKTEPGGDGSASSQSSSPDSSDTSDVPQATNLASIGSRS